MKRRQFLQTAVLGSVALNGLLSCSGKTKKMPGKILGASSRYGHLLREALPKTEPAAITEKNTVIIGGGISGLSAAYYLTKNNFDDFAVLELEKDPGGNASFLSNEISAFPLGAHYIPTPNSYLKEYLDLLQELNVVTGYTGEGLPIYNDFHLCFDQQERLHINGRWQDGLVPHFGLQQTEKEEIERFLQMMDAFRQMKGKDGKYAFDIPVDESSGDYEITKLDSITMAEWLRQNNFQNGYLQWYVNYCTRDDFGTDTDSISAWAGIHYFAARRGHAANAGHSDVITWPEGNGFLVKGLMAAFADKIFCNNLVYFIESTPGTVQIHTLDTQSGKKKIIKARHCIIAVPQFVAARLLKDSVRTDLVRKNFHYTPWLVANIKTRPFAQPADAAICWDNVIYGSKSLGYVDATHQQLQQQHALKNLTYYYPFTDGNCTEQRKVLEKKSHAALCAEILDDLKKVHSDAEDKTAEINIQLWGHSMVQPRPGIIHGKIRNALAASLNNSIHFAHTDLAGISIFEEAFYQGIKAGKKVLQQ